MARPDSSAVIERKKGMSRKEYLMECMRRGMSPEETAAEVGLGTEVIIRDAKALGGGVKRVIWIPESETVTSSGNAG